MGFGSIEDLLEFLMELNKVAINTLEGVQLAHAVELFVDLCPLNIIEPVSWVWFLLNLTTGACQEESPLWHIDLVISEQDLSTEQEGEE